MTREAQEEENYLQSLKDNQKLVRYDMRFIKEMDVIENKTKYFRINNPLSVMRQSNTSFFSFGGTLNESILLIATLSKCTILLGKILEFYCTLLNCTRLHINRF
jgi:hypothetical protein